MHLLQERDHRDVAITDRVDVYVEAGDMHPLNVLEDDLAAMLQLAARMMSLCLRKRGDGCFGSIFVGMGPNIGTDG